MKNSFENEITTFTREKTLDQSAKEQLGKDYGVFLAKRKDGTDSDYVLIKDREIIYGTKFFEQMAVHMEALARIRRED